MRIAPQVRLSLAAFVAWLVLLAASVSCGAREPERRRPAPRFEGATIPEPPRQHERWTAPESSLPKFLTRACATLFDQGLADPRGCDYRAIEISVGSVWSHAGAVVATHGWVLPQAAGEPSQFAVTWSGLVYPVVSVGGQADLEADARRLEDVARATDKANAKRRFPNAGSAFARRFGASDEAHAVSWNGLHPFKVCLLLRIGRADLAERVWAAGTSRPREELGKAKVDLTDYGVSYLTMAQDLAWYHFDRAVCAHMRGDDALALADARMLTTFRNAAEARVKELGFHETAAPIDFLGQLPELLADHERRTREPRRPKPPPRGADKQARIAALIAGLDEVAVGQHSQPGGVNLGESPIIKALIASGDDAVEPLLEALETDVRLTRSVHFHRDFGRSRTIMGAHEAAYVALSGLLKTSFFGAVATGDNLSARGLQGRKAVANQIRAYWQKNRDVPLVERWYRTLADDLAGPREWLQAAGDIVQQENVSVIPGSTAFTMTTSAPLPPGARPKLRGEALRAKQDLSVAELLAMRARAIDPGGPLGKNGSAQFRVQSANQMAEMLARWDPKAAQPLLKERMNRCARAVQAGQGARTRYFGMEASIARLTNLRIEAGDPDALNDYAAWVRTVTPSHFDFPPYEMFEPLWKHPDHGAVSAAADALFGDPKSPWNPSVELTGPGADREIRQRLLTSRLLGLKAFRTLVLRALADRTQVGTVEVGPAGEVIVVQGNRRYVEREGVISGGTPYLDNPKTPTQRPTSPNPRELPLRRADCVCETLQPLEGMPRFLKQWPVARRDKAIDACVAYLTQYGERFRESEGSRAIDRMTPGDPSRETAIIAFDPLDHPATSADVAAGRAIFSLAGTRDEVRRISLPSMPVDARWTKLEVFRDDPPKARIFDLQSGRELSNTPALQSGRVWQIEEVRKVGRWRRYYGFVGRHAVQRVPADEIELLPPWREGWSSVGADLDARLAVEGNSTAGPLALEVWFRNHRGVDTSVPSDLVRNAGAASTVRDGIAFRLTRISETPAPGDPFAQLVADAEPPLLAEEIPALPVGRHPRGTASQTISPAGRIKSLALDLRKLFHVDRPGRYRLEISFDDWKAPDGGPVKIAAEFPVVAAAAEE